MVSGFISSFMVKYFKYIAGFFIIYLIVKSNILWHYLETRPLSNLKPIRNVEDRNRLTDAPVANYQHLHDGNGSSDTFINLEYKSNYSTEAATVGNFEDRSRLTDASIANYKHLHDGNSSSNTFINLEYESSNSTEAATARHNQVPTGNNSVDKFSSCSRDASLNAFDKRKNPLFDGKYLLNNNSICCGPTPITAIVVVHTAPAHFDHRQNIRETYGSRELFLPIEIRVIFLLGRVKILEMQNKILRENSQYGDIIQGNFIDAYHNLTLKAVMGLHWVSHFCSKVKYVIKTDDDAMFDMWRFLELVHAKNLYVFNSIYCFSQNRNKIPRHGKWALDDVYFKGQKNYPFEYCIGFVIVYSSDVIPILYRASYEVPFLWLDDVYVTGMLRTAADTNITIIPQGGNLTLGSGKGDVTCLKYWHHKCSHLAFGIRQSTLRDTWNILIKKRDQK